MGGGLLERKIRLSPKKWRVHTHAALHQTKTVSVRIAATKGITNKVTHTHTHAHTHTHTRRERERSF